MLLVVGLARIRAFPASARSRRQWLDVARCAPFAAVALAVAAIPVTSVQATTGTAHAGMAGELPGEPWPLLVAGSCCAALLVGRLGRTWCQLLLGAVAGMLVATGVLLRGAGRGLDLSQYYPMKSLWFLALLLSPVVAVIGTAVAATVARRVSGLLDAAGRYARVLRVTVAAVVAAVAFAYWLPWMLGTTGPTTTNAVQDAVGAAVGRSSTSYSAQRYDIAVEYGPEHRDEVVVPFVVGYSVVLDRFSDQLVSKLLSVQTGQPELPVGVGLCETVEHVAGGRPAVVISRLDAADVRGLLAGCEGLAVVERLPGEDLPDAEFATRVS
jgi:hypothetical protein